MEEKAKVHGDKLGLFEEESFVLTDEEIHYISKHFLLMQ